MTEEKKTAGSLPWQWKEYIIGATGGIGIGLLVYILYRGLFGSSSAGIPPIPQDIPAFRDLSKEAWQAVYEGMRRAGEFSVRDLPQ